MIRKKKTNLRLSLGTHGSGLCRRVGPGQPGASLLFSGRWWPWLPGEGPLRVRCLLAGTFAPSTDFDSRPQQLSQQSCQQSPVSCLHAVLRAPWLSSRNSEEHFEIREPSFGGWGGAVIARIRRPSEGPWGLTFPDRQGPPLRTGRTVDTSSRLTAGMGSGVP